MVALPEHQQLDRSARQLVNRYCHDVPTDSESCLYEAKRTCLSVCKAAWTSQQPTPHGPGREQGEGVPPSEARACCEWLQSSSAPALHIPFSVLAAGDRTYVHFCACGKALDARCCTPWTSCCALLVESCKA